MLWSRLGHDALPEVLLHIFPRLLMITVEWGRSAVCLVVLATFPTALQWCIRALSAPYQQLYAHEDGAVHSSADCGRCRQLLVSYLC